MEIFSELLNKPNYLIAMVETGKTLAVTHLPPFVAVNAWHIDDFPCISSLT